MDKDDMDQMDWILDQRDSALADNERLLAQNKALKDILRECEWNERGWSEDFCPVCGNLRSQGHYPDCRLAALLKEE